MGVGRSGRDGRQAAGRYDTQPAAGNREGAAAADLRASSHSTPRAPTPPEVSAALFHRDILDFIALLTKHRVRYLIVGGEAVIQHGYARFTGDVDMFFDAAASNAA